MNTDKTLDSKFINRKDYPIWYYKELHEVEVDYVIAYLLKETFIVDIDGSKHEITFGYNKKDNYVGQCIKYDDIKNSNLSSYKVVEKGFREGKWFIITDKDTTEEFKAEYRKRKEQHEKEELTQWYKRILGDVVRDGKDLTEEQRNNLLMGLKDTSFEELEKLVKALFDKFKE